VKPQCRVLALNLENKKSWCWSSSYSSQGKGLDGVVRMLQFVYAAVHCCSASVPLRFLGCTPPPT